MAAPCGWRHLQVWVLSCLFACFGSCASSTPRERTREAHRTMPERVRLYSKGVILGYKRSKVNQHTHTSLIRIDGVNCSDDTDFYLGKRIAYIYKAKTKKQGSKYRCIWGKVCRSHGTSGVVRAKFRKNLPPCSLGGRVRVMLYPSRV